MPQLRSGARRGRRPAVAAPAAAPNKGRARVNEVTGGTAGKRTAGNRVDDVVGAGEVNEVVVGCGGETDAGAALRGTASLKVGEDNSNELEEVREVEEKEMDECDSGGNGSKGLGAEDEGSTTPIPERVS